MDGTGQEPMSSVALTLKLFYGRRYQAKVMVLRDGNALEGTRIKWI